MKNSQSKQFLKNQTNNNNTHKQNCFTIGLFMIATFSFLIIMQGAPDCIKLQRETVSIQQMNKTRANVVMEYRMPIIYVWLGSQIPHRYLQRLKWIRFPYKVIGQKQWQQLGTEFHKFKLQNVQKADILRLLYLQKYAGLYSDLDNILDYECLMKILARKKGFWMAGEPFVDWEPYASNLLLFVDSPKNEHIRRVLQAIKQKLKSLKGNQKKDFTFIFQTTGPLILAHSGVQKMNDLYKCQDHQRDGVWAK